MLELIAALLAAQLASNGAGQSFDPSQWQGQFEGNCSYTQPVRELAVDDILIQCNQANIDGSGVALSSRSWGVRTRFTGSWAGDRLAVNSISLRDNRAIEAKGVCQVYLIDESLSVVACAATARGRTYIANFVRSRL